MLRVQQLWHFLHPEASVNVKDGARFTSHYGVRQRINKNHGNHAPPRPVQGVSRSE
jgi:hypothetical protein